MNLLNSYYTEEIFSKLLIENLNYSTPSLIVDIGIGEGSLCSAAYKKWTKALYYGFDANANVIKHIEQTLPFVKIHLADSLKSGFPKNTAIKVGSVDIAICNPPYLKLQQNSKYAKLFQHANLHPCNELKYLTADLVFLAQNLKLLKQNGILGIILPDSLLTNHDFRSFRSCLLNNYDIEKIIQLPDGIFNKTEARTHIIIIRNRKPLQTDIKLYKANRKGKCSSPLFVAKEKLEKRMDFKYHIVQRSLIQKSTLKLSDAIEYVKRGNQSGKELRELDIHHLHLPGIYKKYIFLPNHRYPINSNYIIAKKGDILINRVGKRSVGKVARIASGRIAISDCLFVIRPKKGFALRVWKTLNSSSGNKWLQMLSHGVCSQVISKVDLLELPIKNS